MVDLEAITYYAKDVLKRPNIPWSSGDAEIVSETFNELKRRMGDKYPKMRLIERPGLDFTTYYIVLNQKAMNRLISNIEEHLSVLISRTYDEYELLKRLKGEKDEESET